MLYQRVMRVIRGIIVDQELKPGDQIPTEKQLSQMTGASIITVRRAVSVLVQRGVLTKQQGRGTFVTSPRVVATVGRPGSLRHALESDPTFHQVSTRLLKFEKGPCNEKEAQFLSLQTSAAVWRVSRLRTIDGIPSIIDNAVIPVVLAPTLTKEVLKKGASLADFLEHELGLTEYREDQYLYVTMPTQ